MHPVTSCNLTHVGQPPQTVRIDGTVGKVHTYAVDITPMKCQRAINADTKEVPWLGDMHSSSCRLCDQTQMPSSKRGLSFIQLALTAQGPCQ